MSFNKPRYLNDAMKAEISKSIKAGEPVNINKLVFGRSVKSNYVKNILGKSPKSFDIKKIKKPSANLVKKFGAPKPFDITTVKRKEKPKKKLTKLELEFLKMLK